MKPNYWLILFVTDALLHLATTIYPLPTLSLVTKPLLMILLAGYFISLLNNQPSKLKILVLIALVCSWFGDTFLMFEADNSLFFILGLSSFLLAHVTYILIFKKFEKKVSKSALFLIIILFGSYSLVLSYLLWPGLGDMKIPVIVYAIVLTIMGIMGVVKNLHINSMVVIGVALFILSDSLIAYTKFVEPIAVSRFMIMSTYIIAQFLIVKGLSERIKVYT